MSRPDITLPVPADSGVITSLTFIAALPPTVVLMVDSRAGWARGSSHGRSPAPSRGMFFRAGGSPTVDLRPVDLRPSGHVRMVKSETGRNHR
jgi:hypothetical protein